MDNMFEVLHYITLLADGTLVRKGVDKLVLLVL